MNIFEQHFDKLRIVIVNGFLCLFLHLMLHYTAITTVFFSGMDEGGAACIVQPTPASNKSSNTEKWTFSKPSRLFDATDLSSLRTWLVIVVFMAAL